MLVPYTDPGLALARAIRAGVLAHIRRRDQLPRTILLGNHGLIAIGGTPAAVLSATLMAEKAATIFLGAARIGGPRFLPPAQVARIAGRPDEHYRQKVLARTFRTHAQGSHTLRRAYDVRANGKTTPFDLG
ncbi:MAG: hypothetical protein A3K13_13300 [Gemmatimonadetes bacterium RIFCSPLOWO2_12_FULL_68_9]|nr:MAG: hypothetical protein A3K13_13300 [Gemmatimonadetes bacterium RIFCSPLOWO2_12_FULL_68_9]